ncbi:MAG: hypothetical protein DRQ40_02865 [Gammaproteobacteria bacterium]|nr:MAG: hypothetical protein DRQ40_02865 [Gammaproteobacteria bacterium]
MEIFDPITRSQSILQQMSLVSSTDDKQKLTSLLTSLSTELDNIKLIAHQLTEEISQLQEGQTKLLSLGATQSIIKPEIKSGCYIFGNEKGFFCPSCYDKSGNKVATTRINSKLRVCPACRASIK